MDNGADSVLRCTRYSVVLFCLVGSITFLETGYNRTGHDGIIELILPLAQETEKALMVECVYDSIVQYNVIMERCICPYWY